MIDDGGKDDCLLLIMQGLMLSLLVQCQQGLENNINGVNATQLNDPAALNQRLSAVTSHLIHSEIARRATFCITNPEDDWNRAFNFSDNLDFLSTCILTTQGDLPQRLCTAADLKFYFTNFIGTATSPKTFLNPNRNCNLTAWVSGCEPGWACSAGFNQPVDFTESDEIPPRTDDCKPCCEGFFCPQGLICMIHIFTNYLPESRIILVEELTFGQMLAEVVQCSVQQDHIVPQTNKKYLAQAVLVQSFLFVSLNFRHYCRMGSTAETRCYKLTSCDANTTRQNITQYGLMLIVAISVLLFIFYNCYEQVITIRGRRYARSREAAAKSVKENAQARARWLAAKDAVKKRAIELQSQVSRSFSRRNSIISSEHVRILSQTEVVADDYSHQFLSHNSSSSEHNDAASGRKETGAGYPPIQEIEESSDSSDGFDAETENKNQKRKQQTKHARTNTQIFKYAYSQLEKEKAQLKRNRDLTLSGVISMATNSETRRRPPVEIAFRDLTVTLKQKKKHLLRSVTGEIRPGRITALMGPSGAGKTTLLSALAGKTVGCSITGLVLINGKGESIRSYKKIVGFVPQDDIVHGNLTVEENIWFSANCRLSAELPKPDKVLVVERVIESLGLQPVRDSLVGTVEKRGISGGQRKRVNVGLELVMEPSLLFLDEPTSGLDSSSSQLLLRARRREVLEGVNICMVVHQPSYSLFKMFDDLILLAKGGLTVYHGSVRDVEEYFAQLGINVPERVNPPDYFIDVLEGMIKPNTSSGVSYEELPLRWMLHKGYPLPPDMQPNESGLEAPVINVDSKNQGNDANSGPEQLSFCGEFWQNVKYKLEARCDVIQNNFLKSKDLSRRRTPSILLQYRIVNKLFCNQINCQTAPERSQNPSYRLPYFVACWCLFGLIAKASDESFGAPGYTYTVIATSLLCKIAALRTFSLDKLQYRRERASGISSLAHFVAKDTIDHFNTLIKPLVYLSMFYFFSNPRSYFIDNYIVLLCLVYCVTGIAYALAIFLEPGSSQLCSVLLPVVLTLLSTQPKDSKFMKILTYLCYPSWALEAFIVSNAKRYYGVWLIQRCGALLRNNYNLHHWGLCISLLMAAGAASRALAFFGMLTLQKK
ncbi:ABC transporter G family member 28 [Sesamum angolense]|uniref:ABC transporter G family member 28 n=1 Tax=Sesamum angolense TaxID=2727404 RepID=A0AAE2C073_9LAMI|nr:ABC transporter G family member 28 [Sesamum angolense]